MSIKYRPEIDGLRAVAVIPVLLFHAGLPGIGGGFLGVDVFFLISGFLITSILVEDLRQERFSIVDFYERRARRLMPALVVVLLATTMAALVLLPPPFLRAYGQSLVAATAFASNVFFYKTSGYFDDLSEEKPLLHTWSLAIEEQFYIVFPLLLAAAWRLGLSRLRVLLLSLGIASLLLAELLSTRSPEANFYLMPTRAWELLLGCWLALRLRAGRPDRGHPIAAALGLGLILVSYLVFDEATPMPGLWTLLPVAGAAVTICYADPANAVGRLLSNRLVVWVGLISYPLYLWHQPILALIRARSVEPPSPIVLLAGLVASVALAHLTWKHLERPFRERRLLRGRSIMTATVVSMVVLIGLGLLLHLGRGLPARYDHEITQIDRDFSPMRGRCHVGGAPFPPPSAACRYFVDQPSWSVFGNSHSVELAYSLAQDLKPRGDGVLHLSFSGMLPPSQTSEKLDGRRGWINKSLSYLGSQSSIRQVVVSLRHPDFVTETAEREREYWSDYRALLDRLLVDGKRVFVVYPVPELPAHIVKIGYPATIFHTASLVNLPEAINRAEEAARRASLLSRLNGLPWSGRLIAIRSADVLCEATRCSAVVEGRPRYFDDNHLSVRGAKLLSTAILSAYDNLNVERDTVGGDSSAAGVP